MGQGDARTVVDLLGMAKGYFFKGNVAKKVECNLAFHGGFPWQILMGRAWEYQSFHHQNLGGPADFPQSIQTTSINLGFATCQDSRICLQSHQSNSGNLTIKLNIHDITII